MNDASQENEIISRWRAGQAQRRIARELGINRKRQSSARNGAPLPNVRRHGGHRPRCRHP